MASGQRRRGSQPAVTRGRPGITKFKAPEGKLPNHMDIKRNQLETRIATLELMLVTERARPKANQDDIDKLKNQLAEARAALEKYDQDTR
jgi:hypothetical protein